MFNTNYPITKLPIHNISSNLAHYEKKAHQTESLKAKYILVIFAHLTGS